MDYSYEQLDPPEPDPANRCPNCWAFVSVIREDGKFPRPSECKRCAKKKAAA